MSKNYRFIVLAGAGMQICLTGLRSREIGFLVLRWLFLQECSGGIVRRESIGLMQFFAMETFPAL